VCLSQENNGNATWAKNELVKMDKADARDSQRIYLTNLTSSGSVGNASWAKEQLVDLNRAVKRDDLYEKSNNGDATAKQELSRMFREEGQDNLKKLAQSSDYDGKMAKTELNRRSEIERQAQMARQAELARQAALNTKGSSFDVKIGANGVPVSIYNASEALKYQTTGQASPVPSQTNKYPYQPTSTSFASKTGSFFEGAGDAALGNVTLGLIQNDPSSKNTKSYIAGKIFGDIVATVGGIGEVVAGAATEAAGIVLDATGIGAIVGVPLNVAGVAVVAHGSATTYNGASNLGKDISDLVQNFKGSSSGGISKAEQLKQNNSNGKQYEKEVVEGMKDTNKNVVEQITVTTNKSGTKTILDVVGIDKTTGKINVVEAKGSATAPLTKNQKIAHPEIAESGATVVGKGKPPFTGGTQIPPTDVIVMRKNN
jgi:hypothetical protein